MRVLLLFPALLILLVSEPAASQDSTTAHAPSVTRPTNAMPADSLVPGMRIRLFEMGVPFRRAGYLYAVRGDTLVFRMDRNFQSVLLTRANILELSVYAGRGSTGSRLAFGAGIGALAGLVAGVAKQELRDEQEGSQRKNGMLIGAALGVIVATVIPGERWRPVWLHGT